MKLLLTGAARFQGEQKDPSKSLGGFISITEIENGLLSNLFDSASPYNLQLDKAEIRAVAIFNDGVTMLTNLKAYFEYPEDSEGNETNIYDYKIGYIEAQADDCGEIYIKGTNSPYAIPYQVTLVSNVEEEGNALALPDLSAGAYLGIFIQRIPKTQIPLSDDELLEILEGTLVPLTEENILLTFAWN